jgi:glycosyl hydrolase family 99/VCBS repeat protein
MLMRWLGMGLVAVAAVASVSASASVSPGWTVAEARVLLGRVPVTATDVRQADRPTFTLRFQRVTVLGVGGATGKGGERRWRRFSIFGTAVDQASGVRIAVKLLIRVAGPRSFAIDSFRGPPPNPGRVRFPIRAAFYYPWYPENWSAGSFFPFTKLHPVLGVYDSGSGVVIRRHIESLRYGGFSAAISSWWGPGERTDRRLSALLAAARQTPLRFGVYYEHEGYANPPVQQIRSDLHYLRDRYFSQPAYLRVNGKPVVFVYAPGDDACEVAARWSKANDVGAYIDMETNGWMGATGTYSPFPASATGGVRVAAGDVTGDHQADLVAATGPGSTPRVAVLDARTGAVTSSFRPGGSGAGVEVAVVGGRVVTGTDSVVSEWNATGTRFTSVDTGLPQPRVAGGDLDGDGKPEVLVAGASTVLILDGKTLAIRGTVTPFAGAHVFGIAAGDIDGDGKAEIIAGSGYGGTGEVRALRPNGTAVGTIADVYPGDEGGLRVGAGDLNGDGRADVITGPAYGAPDIHTYTFTSSGLVQDPPAGFFAFDHDLAGGVSVAAANLSGGAPDELITGIGADHPPAIRTWGSFDSCKPAPSSWHYYGISTSGEYRWAASRAFTINPGFFFAGDAAPQIPRDLARWKQNVRDMVASGDAWQLVVSFNEWNEATSVEAANEWASPSGFGAYLDALHTNGR